MTTLSKTLKIKSPVKKRYTNETSGIEVEYQHSPQLLIHYDIIEDINYHSLKCFDASKLLSTSFKVITPFNVAKIYVKNEDGGYFEIAKVEILKSENQLNILNTTDRTFKVELDAKVIFNLAEALKYSAVLSNEEKRIFEEDFKQLGQHKLYLTMHFAYNVDKYDNRSEISRFFNAQTLNFAIKYGNNMFGWTVDGVRVSANNANHQVVLTNYTQLLDYIKKVSILHSKDPSVLFFLKDNKELMSQVGMAKDSYLKILKEIANTQDDSKIAINIDVDLKNIENHSRHKIGKVRFSDLKNKLKQRTMPSGLANQNGR